MRYSRLLVTTLAVTMFGLGIARAEPLRVAAAGSLTDAFTDLLHRFPAGADSVAPATFGPSGLLRDKIEASGGFDLFASADMGQPRRLAQGHPERIVLHFTRNKLCAFARATVGLNGETMLERLLDPKTRVATSTPGADPGGDYAWEMFARADAVRPGARAMLEAKALKLVGGGDATPLLVPGKGAVEGVFLADKADVMLAYCSGGTSLLAAVPGLVSLPLPPALAVGAEYGMVLLNDRAPTLRLAAFILSEAGQAVLHDYGFDPVGYLPPPTPSLLVGRTGQVARRVALARLPPARLHVDADPAHKTPARDWSGARLWDVLVAAGAVEPSKPAGQVREIVRITGADGYTAVLGLGEIAPEFANHPVLLADHLDDAAIPHEAWRLIVPGEQRLGRSVRDVMRIDVEAR